MDSGIVQRTFRIAFVVMFGGLIVNPFVNLKEAMSGVAPIIESMSEKIYLQSGSVANRLTDSEHDVIDFSPGISCLIPGTFHVVCDQRVSLNKFSFSRVDVGFHPFIVIKNACVSQQESCGMTLI